MKPKKLNFAEIKNVLSRNEMKKIMAGSGSGGGGTICLWDSDCGTITVTCSNGGSITAVGHCYYNSGAPTKTCHYAGCPS